MVFALFAGSAAALVFVAQRGPGLPPYAHLSNLPASFDTALRQARARAESNGNAPDAVRALAKLYLANGLNEEAMACYRSRRLAATLNAQDHYYLAQIDQDAGDLDAAVSELRACAADAPVPVAARLQLADCLFKTGDTSGAGQEYRKVLDGEPGQAQAMFGLARVELQAGDEAGATAELDKLMALHPDNASGAGLYAQILDRRGDRAKAEVMTLESRQKPEAPAADSWTDELFSECFDLQRLSLGFEQYFNAGAVERAAPIMNRIEQIDAQNPIPPFVRGWSLARAHRDAEAVQEYRTALDRGGDPEKIGPFMVQSLIALGRLDEADRLLAAECAQKPDSVPLLTVYADLAVRRGDVAEARPLLAKVLERQPYLQSANMALAKILWDGGDRDGAARYLRRIADAYPGDIGSRALLGEYYLGRADAGRAISPLEQALASARAGTDAARELSANLYRAYLASAKDAAAADGARAVATVEKAIRLLPAEPDAYALKAGLCAAQGELGPAAEALAKLASLQPGNPTVFLSWGDIALKQGDAALAAEKWRAALALTPDSDGPLREAILARLASGGPPP